MKKILAIWLILAIGVIFAGCTSESDTNFDSYQSSSFDDNSYSGETSSDYDYDYDYDSDYGEGYSYDSNDEYYSNNDHNNDGKISDSEFQDAMGDYLDDLMGYY